MVHCCSVSLFNRTEKTHRHLEGLPTNLKKYFVKDKPGIIDEFTKMLKDIKREQYYEQKSFLQQLSVKSTNFQPNIPPQLNLNKSVPTQVIR